MWSFPGVHGCRLWYMRRWSQESDGNINKILFSVAVFDRWRLSKQFSTANNIFKATPLTNFSFSGQIGKVP